MEMVLLFLANAVASGTIGHYVSKGLDKIDPSLSELLQKNSDIEPIKRIIEEKGIESEVLEFAKNTLSGSIILPTLSSESITNKDKTELFYIFIKIGLELSYRLKIDLLLPSSFVSKNSFTLFSSGGSQYNSFESTGLEIVLKDIYATFDKRELLYIISVESEEEKNTIWEKYLDELSQYREETEKYLDIESTSKDIADRKNDSLIAKVTAGACYFENDMLMKDGNECMSKSEYWFESFKEMTDGIKKVIDLQVLSSHESNRLREAYSHIKNILEITLN